MVLTPSNSSRKIFYESTRPTQCTRKTSPFPQAGRETGIPLQGGQTAVLRGQLLLLPCTHSQLICLEQQLKPTANPAHKIPPHSCHSLLLGTLLPLTLASCYSPWLPLKSLFICLIANEQNTTAYFLHCLKIFHGDVSCRDSFLQHMTKFSWRLAQKGSRLRQSLVERKSFARTGPWQGDMRAFPTVTLQSTQVFVEGGSQHWPL